MRAAPPELSEQDLVDVVRRGWEVEIAAADHLPWGFGAWHWSGADEGGVRRWFVTADRLESPTRLEELERAYATARVVSQTLPALAPIVRASGEICWEEKGFAISVTPWQERSESKHGKDLEADDTLVTADFLASLHSLDTPPMTREWSPTYASHQTLDALPRLLESDWVAGPFGEQARQLLASHVDDIDGWRERYAWCARHALERRSEWVLTHGEPGQHNQLEVSGGRRLWVDWESALVAPRERDLATLIGASPHWRQAYLCPVDPVCLELFDLAWRLDEIGQYTGWFHGPHGDSKDESIAWGGLQNELTRADRH